MSEREAHDFAGVVTSVAVGIGFVLTAIWGYDFFTIGGMLCWIFPALIIGYIGHAIYRHFVPDVYPGRPYWLEALIICIVSAVVVSGALVYSFY